MEPIHISIEQCEDQWIAYVPALLGCYSCDKNRETAISTIPAAIMSYLGWVTAIGPYTSTVDPAAPIVIDEIVAERLHENGEVNAFFAADSPPLTGAEIARAACLFDLTYRDLLSAVEGLTDEVMLMPVEGEWNIDGILCHTAAGEGWYLSRLGLAPEGFRQIEDSRTLLDTIHHHTLQVLPALEGVDRLEYVSGELWSPRKMLRRMLWHRRDHFNHINQFKARIEQSTSNSLQSPTV